MKPFYSYLESNITMSSGWRIGASDLPKDLHHRPPFLVRHLREANLRAADIDASMIRPDPKDAEGRTFFVPSLTRQGAVYCVKLGPNMPSCGCYSFTRSHLPCKHMAAVFAHATFGWSMLPLAYRLVPYS